MAKSRGRGQLFGFLIVAISMMAMYLLPRGLFVSVAFVSTTCMILVTYSLTKYSALFSFKFRSVAFGLISAAVLYGIFFAGNYAIKTLHPLGISSTSETSIYSLISSHSPLLQIAVLLLDSVGFESYFRGNLQNYLLAKSGGKLGPGAVFASSLVDALIHLVSLNPLWAITTFIADSVWGLTYYYARDISASIVSHFAWDILIFVIFPIR